MEESAERMWLNGESGMLFTWVAQLPDEVLLAHTNIAYTTVLHLLLQAYYMQDQQWILAVNKTEQIRARIEPHLESRFVLHLPSTEAHLLRNRIALLRLWIKGREIRLKNDMVQYYKIGLQMQELASEDNAV
jgi:hypothetical protein